MPISVRGLTRVALVGVLVVGAVSVLPARAQEAPGPVGPAVVGGCRAIGGADADPFCRTLEQATRVASQLCRTATAHRDEAAAVCAQTNGLVISEESVAGYEASWVHEAHRLQRALDRDVPLYDALFPGTHNSYNSARYTPTLSRSDHNQLYSMRDQLRMDMRSLEIDIHWAPSPYEPDDQGRALVTCHATQVDQLPGVHVGCTHEETLDVALAELRGWLDEPANADEVVLLYLENQLEDNQAAHDRAAEVIEATLGADVYQPPAGAPCAPMPTGLSKADLRAAGARVLIVGNCGPGGWGAWVHERDQDGGTWRESSSGGQFACAEEEPYGTTFIRYYEDSTGLSYMAQYADLGGPSAITPAEAAAMTACGVNLFGFDQIHPGDARLAATLWSWGPAAWTRGDCAYSGTDGRFHGGDCAQVRRFACQDAKGRWDVTRKVGSWSEGARECKGKRGFGVPATGPDNVALRAAVAAAGGGEVWLDYAVTGGSWLPDALD
jgi:hypothetical protein